MHLLDVNVLISLCDTTHEFFPKAFAWFQKNASSGWATCPITENGVLRIIGHPQFPGGGSGTPEGAAIALRGMTGTVPGHQFLADDISLLTTFSTLGPMTSGQLTDVYLLALAVKHGAKFLTLDQRIDPALVIGGPQAFEILA
jgi:predicted nucleic acid-binding protein